jgi:hypothetical protein
MFTRTTDIETLLPRNCPDLGQAIFADVHLSFNATATDTIGD